MTRRTCDLCKHEITGKNGVSFNGYDLCGDCTLMARRATCQKCRGEGTLKVRDDEETLYKTVKCKNCSKEK